MSVCETERPYRHENPYYVKFTVMEDGERVPLLHRRRNDLPLYFPNAYALTTDRTAHRAAATIENNLRYIAVLYLFAEGHRFDLEARFRGGSFLTQTEVAALCAFAGWSVRGMLTQQKPTSHRGTTSRRTKRSGVVRRIKIARIHTVKRYLAWLASFFIGLADEARVGDLSEKLNLMLASFKASTPREASRNQLNARRAPDMTALDRLLAVVHPDSPENPWPKSKFCRHRNFVIVLLALLIGLRRGEILGLKIRDIDLRKEEITVTRRADDPEDSRVDQPNAKTHDRRLPLRRTLTRILSDFQTDIRGTVGGARRHRFLITASNRGGGKPLSKSGYSRIFQDLRSRVTDLPRNLCGHLLRHANNENMFADGEGISPELEERLRDYLNGHTPGAGSSRFYLRRRIERRTGWAKSRPQSGVGERTSLKIQHTTT